MYMFSTLAEVNNFFYNFFSIWLYFYNKRQQKYHKSAKKLSAQNFLHHQLLIFWYLIYVKYMLYLQVQCDTPREFLALLPFSATKNKPKLALNKDWSETSAIHSQHFIPSNLRFCGYLELNNTAMLSQLNEQSICQK